MVPLHDTCPSFPLTGWATNTWNLTSRTIISWVSEKFNYVVICYETKWNWLVESGSYCNNRKERVYFCCLFGLQLLRQCQCSCIHTHTEASYPLWYKLRACLENRSQEFQSRFRPKHKTHGLCQNPVLVYWNSCKWFSKHSMNGSAWEHVTLSL